MTSWNHLEAATVHRGVVQRGPDLQLWLLAQSPEGSTILVPADGAAPWLPLVEQDGAVEDDAARDARARHPLEQRVGEPREEALVLLQPLDLPVGERGTPPAESRVLVVSRLGVHLEEEPGVGDAPEHQILRALAQRGEPVVFEHTSERCVALGVQSRERRAEVHPLGSCS
jgi:hypothetical protein